MNSPEIESVSTWKPELIHGDIKSSYNFITFFSLDWYEIIYPNKKVYGHFPSPTILTVLPDFQPDTTASRDLHARPKEKNLPSRCNARSDVDGLRLTAPEDRRRFSKHILLPDKMHYRRFYFIFLFFLISYHHSYTWPLPSAQKSLPYPNQTQIIFKN